MSEVKNIENNSTAGEKQTSEKVNDRISQNSQIIIKEQIETMEVHHPHHVTHKKIGSSIETKKYIS
jgi:hypothetical protein